MSETVPGFDVPRHVAEILDGVAQANLELGGNLEVEAIELMPGDQPGLNQARHVAHKIARAVLKGEI